MKNASRISAKISSFGTLRITCGRKRAINAAAMVNRTARNTNGEARSRLFFTRHEGGSPDQRAEGQ